MLFGTLRDRRRMRGHAAVRCVLFGRDGPVRIYPVVARTLRLPNQTIASEDRNIALEFGRETRLRDGPQAGDDRVGVIDPVPGPEHGHQIRMLLGRPYSSRRTEHTTQTRGGFGERRVLDLQRCDRDGGA
jgi:hypothetical protein